MDRAPGRAPRLVFEPPAPQKNAELPSSGVLKFNYNGWPSTTWNAPIKYEGFERRITVIDHNAPEDVQSEIAQRKEELQQYMDLAKKGSFSLAQVMAGETVINDKIHHFSTPSGVLGKYPYRHPESRLLTSGQFYTGRDNVWSDKEFPLVNYKFYMALNTGTPEKKAAADQFVTDIVEECVKRKIALDTKSFDHDYDSFNLYTCDLIEMTKLLKELYPKYVGMGIFHEAQRYFQGPIEGINPLHIAWVQEPTGGWKSTSHSVRMGRLGAYIEKGHSYEEACDLMGVQPWAPWLVDKTKA